MSLSGSAQRAQAQREWPQTVRARRSVCMSHWPCVDPFPSPCWSRSSCVELSPRAGRVNRLTDGSRWDSTPLSLSAEPPSRSVAAPSPSPAPIWSGAMSLTATVCARNGMGEWRRKERRERRERIRQVRAPRWAGNKQKKGPPQVHTSPAQRATIS